MARRAVTVKSAVQSMSVGTMNSPNGTAKNKKPNGNASLRATRQPATAGTTAMIINTIAKWVTTPACAMTPSSQRNPAPASAISPATDGWKDA